jgi:hypothetical protein
MFYADFTIFPFFEEMEKFKRETKTKASNIK